MEPDTAVVAGAGPGMGTSIVEKFLDEGLNFSCFSRTGGSMELEDKSRENDRLLSLSVDVSVEEEVDRGFDRVWEEF